MKPPLERAEARATRRRTTSVFGQGSWIPAFARIHRSCGVPCRALAQADPGCGPPQRGRAPAPPPRARIAARWPARRFEVEDFELATVHYVAACGFVLAAVFGFVANKTNFCTMGAVSDALHMGSRGRLGAWFFAMGLAILGTQALDAAGLVDLAGAMYLTPNFGWLGYIVGGIAFGVGMTLAAGCGQRNLVRFGGGNLKALVVLLVLGITAYTTRARPAGARPHHRIRSPQRRSGDARARRPGARDVARPGARPSARDRRRRLGAGGAGGPARRRPHRVRAGAVRVSAKLRRPARRHRHRRGHHRRLVRDRLHRQRRLRAGAARVDDLRRADRQRHQLPHDLHRLHHQLRDRGGARHDRRLVRVRGDVGQLSRRDLRHPFGDGEPPRRRLC